MVNLTRNEWIAVVVALAVVGFFFIFGQPLVSYFNFNNNLSMNDQNQATSTEQSSNLSAQNIPGLAIQDEVAGTGKEAVNGATVTVNYVGTFPNGIKFDSSIDRGQPFSFVLGAGQVIKGWDLGVAGMKVGGKRKLTIGPELGYGSQAIGPIPANSTLVFEVELLDVTPAR
jgi:FKBP-type peptidyl-prolyl cis-trans isomerase